MDTTKMQIRAKSKVIHDQSKAKWSKWHHMTKLFSTKK